MNKAVDSVSSGRVMDKMNVFQGAETSHQPSVQVVAPSPVVSVLLY
jgi:hypothetical protein